MIQICSGITRGRVLNGELYTQRLQKLMYPCLSTDCFMKISLHVYILFCNSRYTAPVWSNRFLINSGLSHLCRTDIYWYCVVCFCRHSLRSQCSLLLYASNASNFITSLVKEVMFWKHCFVCLSFFLSVRNIIQKSWTNWGEIYGGVSGGERNKWLDFGSDSDHHADCPIGNLAITQQIMSGFWWNYQDSSAMIQETIDYFFRWFGSPCWPSKSRIRTKGGAE